MIKRAMHLCLVAGVLLALFNFSVGMHPAKTVLAAGVPFNKGDIVVGAGNGKINHFSPTGVPKDILDNGTNADEQTGMVFDSAGNLFSTNHKYSDPTGSVSMFDNSGNHLGIFASGVFSNPESIIQDASNNFYVGNGDYAGPGGTINKLSPSGVPLATYNVKNEEGGAEWIDLAADQCTMYYTSEGFTIFRFNVCTNTQLPNFASVPGGVEGNSPGLYGLRILPDGGILVGGKINIFRFNASGALIATYPAPLPATPVPPATDNPNQLFAINLDPDGIHFWTADYASGIVYRYLIDPVGPADFSFYGGPYPLLNNGEFQEPGGLAIYGELTAARPKAPAKKTQAVPADLVGQLRVTPDREFNLNGGTDNVLTYALTVKNIGQGAASFITAQLPIDPNLLVGYTTIDPAETGVWIQSIVTDAANPYILIGFPGMEPNTKHSLMISFRANPSATAGSSVFTRFRLGWDDDTGTGKHSLSNGVRFTVTGSTNRDDSGGEIQLFGFTSGTNNTFLVGSDFYIPNERVDFWYTDENNQSVALGQLRVDGDGNLVVSVSLAPFQVGKTYTIAGRGNRSEVTGAGLIRVTAATSGTDGNKTFVVETLKNFNLKASLQTLNQLYQSR